MSSYSFALGELASAGCTEEQQKARAKPIAEADAQGGASVLAAGFAASLVSGPPGWLALITGAVGAAVGTSAVTLIFHRNDCD